MTSANETEVSPLTETILRSVQLYYTPILVYLGTLGNFVSMCVFFGTKLRQSSSSVYLGVLAISDTGFLISVFVVWLSMIKVRLFNQQGYCQFFIYLPTLCSFLSVWFVVAFTVERFIAVQYPLQRQSMCTVARAKIVVIGLTVVGAVFCSPVLWFSDVRSRVEENVNVTECVMREGWQSATVVYNYIDTMLTFVLPFAVIVVLNILIARTIYRFAKVRRRMTVDSRNWNESSNQSPQSSLSQRKITKMLLVVSTVFLCLNLPAYTLRACAFLYEEYNVPRSMVLVQQICNLFFNTNFGINFILYCATGQNFRKAMINMLLRRSHKRNSSTGHVSSHNNFELLRSSTSMNRQHANLTFTQSHKGTHELQAFSK